MFICKVAGIVNGTDYSIKQSYTGMLKLNISTNYFGNVDPENVSPKEVVLQILAFADYDASEQEVAEFVNAIKSLWS